MEAVHILFARLLSHGTMLISALTCQIISNVPAAILLSRFTQDACGLLVGVNVGGAGTLVASLASLITFREYTHHVPNGGKQFLFLFLGSALPFDDSFGCHVIPERMSLYCQHLWEKSLLISTVQDIHTLCGLSTCGINEISLKILVAAPTRDRPACGRG